MSNPEVERCIQQMDRDILTYGESIQHVSTTPQGEVEVRRIDPRSTMVNGTNTRTLSLDEAGELYSEFVNHMSIERGVYTVTGGLITDIAYYGTGGASVSDRILASSYNYLDGIIENLEFSDDQPIVHKSKYHKYDINEFGIGDKTKFTVKTPTKLFSIETKNKFEYNKALQDAKQGWFKNWNHE